MDMDGVLVHEEHAIPGADRFLANLRKREAPFLVLTNNSIYTPRDLAARLRASGLEVPEEAIWTSALATSSFLENQRPGGSAFVIGEAGLTTALHDAGYTLTERDPDYVVLGETRTYSFERIALAIRLIVNGARFIATNPDPTGPSPDGPLPATGSVAALITRATGVDPYYVGKPNPLMMRSALNAIDAHSETTAMIGDRMDTDIVSGLEAGLETILVLTGISTRRVRRALPLPPVADRGLGRGPGRPARVGVPPPLVVVVPRVSSGPRATNTRGVLPDIGIFLADLADHARPVDVPARRRARVRGDRRVRRADRAGRDGGRAGRRDRRPGPGVARRRSCSRPGSRRFSATSTSFLLGRRLGRPFLYQHGPRLKLSARPGSSGSSASSTATAARRSSSGASSGSCAPCARSSPAPQGCRCGPSCPTACSARRCGRARSRSPATLPPLLRGGREAAQPRRHRPGRARGDRVRYRTPTRSTTNTSVSSGPMTPPAPRLP